MSAIDIKINIWNLNEPKSLVLRLFSVEDFPNHYLNHYMCCRFGANPINLATKKKTFFTPSNILIIGAFACICIALPVFATMLNLTGSFKPTPVPIPTPTNVPVVIDAMSLMGKSLDEIRSRYSVTDSLIDALPLDKDSSYADASYNEGYTDGKYGFEIVYDKNYRVNQVHSFTGLIPRRSAA